MQPLDRNARITIAAGLAIGTVTLDVALPAQHLGYAFVVPLILIARLRGLRAALALACGSAVGIRGIELLAERAHPAPGDVLSVTLAIAVWTIALVVVEHYEDLLARSYRSASDRLKRELPAAVRAEEAIVRERAFHAIAESIPQLVWRARGDGVAEYYNQAWLSYTGNALETLRDGGIEASIHPGDLERARATWHEALASGTRYDCEYRLRRNDGTYRWFLARATPLQGSDGDVERWFGTCTDIEEQKRTLAQLERRFEVAQHVSESLQHASLPKALPVTRGLAFSATYRAGRREASIGGDWYDAQRLTDGRIVISIGDVLGSGLSAAITMTAMRQAMRGAAHLVPDPVAILEAADRTLREQQPEGIVTAFVGVYDPITRVLVYAGAGHPPPLLRAASGEIVELRSPGLPLGVRRKGDTEARSIEIEPGAFLTLYTDGLIEATHDLSVGERRLRDALESLDVGSGVPAAESIANAVLDGGATDDVAILTVSFAPEQQTLQSEGERLWRFDASDRFAARAAQRALTGALVSSGIGEADVVDAELVFAELVGNVVRHATGPCVVALDTDGEAPVVSVLDRGPGFAATVCAADEFAESGRGLAIVRALVFEFSAEPRHGGGTHARAVLATACRPYRTGAPALPALARAV